MPAPTSPFASPPGFDSGPEHVTRACPVCGSTGHRPHLAKGSLRLVECLKCQMVFASPVEAALLDGRFYHETGRAYYASPTKQAGDFHPARYRRELDLLLQHAPPGPLLDVGCNTGGFLHALAQVAPGRHEALGLEVSAPARAEAERLGLKTVPGPFLTQDFQGQHFAAITFWAVLEHVEHPRLLLERAAALLQPGGCCLVLVPNHQSLAVRLLGARYRYIMPEHINAFTSTTLTRLIATIPSLVVTHRLTTHFNPAVLWQDWRRPRESVPPSDRAALLAKTNAWKSRPGPVGMLARTLYHAGESCLARLGLADNLAFVLKYRPQ